MQQVVFIKVESVRPQQIDQGETCKDNFKESLFEE